MIQKNKKTMIKEKGKEICQRVLDTNDDIPPLANFCKIIYNNYRNVTKLLKHLGGDNENQDNNIWMYPACRNDDW